MVQPYAARAKIYNSAAKELNQDKRNHHKYVSYYLFSTCIGNICAQSSAITWFCSIKYNYL